MDKVASLADQLGDLQGELKALLEDPDSDITEAEKKEAEVNAKKAELDKARALRDRASKHAAEHKAALDFRTETPNFAVQTSSKSEAKSLGTLVSESHSGGKNFKSVEFNDVVLKSTLTSAGLTSRDQPSGIVLVGVQRPTISDLMPNGQTDKQVVPIVQELPFTNSAGMVAEGAQKPELAFSFSEKEFPVRKIAGILPVTDEMLDDHPAMRSYVDQRGVYCIQDREDRQLIGGLGTGQELTGILNTVGVQTLAKVTGDSYADTVRKAITKVQVGGFADPSGLVVNPIDWERMALEKDGNEQYYGPGPFTGAYGNGQPGTLYYWGLQVIATQNCPAGTAIVGAFRTQSQIFRRTGIKVDVSNSHDDYFAYNKQAFRFEERLAFAIMRPSAFIKVTGLTPA